VAFDRILVPLDGSQIAEESLTHAVRIARAYKSRLYLLQVLDVHDGMLEHGPEDLDWRLHKIQALDYLNSLAGPVGEEGIDVETHVMEGRAPDQIVEFVRNCRIDLVVLCAYGRSGISEFPFGGTVQKVLTALATSVLIVRPTSGRRAGQDHYNRILVPLDGSQRSAWAVSLIAGLVTNDSPEIIALHVVSAPDMPRSRPLTREETELCAKLIDCNRRAATAYLEEIRDRFAGRLSIRPRLEVSPHVVKIIEQVANEEHVDLIALTAHGASDPVNRRSGTICQSVVMMASRPVLVLQDTPTRYRDDAEAPTVEWMDRKICAG
jgi:nucleotide-binding universal stress UspA family protein